MLVLYGITYVESKNSTNKVVYKIKMDSYKRKIMDSKGELGEG